MKNYMSWPANSKEIEEKVENLKNQLNFSYPEDPLEDLLMKMNIELYVSDFANESNVWGMIFREEESNIVKVFIKKGDPEERQRFSIAHEIGHLCLHEKAIPKGKYRLDRYVYGNDDASKEECAANFFAATLLMPRRQLCEAQAILGNDVRMLAKAFGVSVAALQNRLSWIEKVKSSVAAQT